LDDSYQQDYRYLQHTVWPSEFYILLMLRYHFFFDILYDIDELSRYWYRFWYL